MHMQCQTWQRHMLSHLHRMWVEIKARTFTCYCCTVSSMRIVELYYCSSIPQQMDR